MTIRLGALGPPHKFSKEEKQRVFYLIAFFDEETLEKALERGDRPHGNWAHHPIFYRAALTKIDELKRAGKYEAEVAKRLPAAKIFEARLRRRRERHQRLISQFVFHPVAEECVTRAHSVSKSDPEWLEKIQSFLDFAEENQMWAIINALFEPSKKDAGRRVGSGAIDDARLISMRDLVRSGKSVAAAASEVVGVSPKREGGTAENQAKALAVRFRLRQSRRKKIDWIW